MKNYIYIMCSLVLLSIFGCVQTATEVQKDRQVITGDRTPKKEQLYTAYNIWIMRAHNMKCINYKYGHHFLPAGTMVRDVDIIRDAQAMTRHISFETVKGDKWFQIDFVSRWHPGKSIEDYKNYMITNKNFEDLTAGLTEKEIDAIRRGTVVKGMSKRSVLISYGYPPEHRTPSLEGRLWTYWRNRFATFHVCFDENGKTTGCP